MHTQIDRFFKYFFEKIYPLTCLNREAKKWGCFEKKIKSPFTCLKWETILGGCFWKNFFEKQKNSSRFIEPRGDVFETLLNCKVSYRNRSVTNQLPKFENLLILGNRIKHISYLSIFKTDTEQHFILTIIWIKSKSNWFFNDFVIW